MRAGAFALSLLSVPLNVQVMQALDEEPRSVFDLRRAVGAPPQTTMRGNLRTLVELGVVERRGPSVFSGTVELELAAPGRDLLAVAEVLESWLVRSPEGPLFVGSFAAKNTVKALVEGWSTAIVRALAARPLSLTELSKLISGVSYPSLERRLTAMRMAGQIEPRPGGGRGTPYEVSDWLRLSVAPLVASARWERANAPQSSQAIGKIDVEAAFLLTIPMLRLPDHLSGTCRLAMELGGGGSRFGGIVANVDEGGVVSCVSRLSSHADGWASGSSGRWLRAMIDGDSDQLEIGGDCELAIELLDGLHRTLFRAPQRA